MTAAKLIVAAAAVLALAGCSAHDNYWGRQINAMPQWQQVKCRIALVDLEIGDIKAFCPKGMPYP